MIRLFSRHRMIADRQGRQRSFNPEELLADLLVCFRECGINDSWLTEHIASVIEEQLDTQTPEGGILGEVELDRFVMTVLSAVGYGEVAEAYGRRRDLGPADLRGNRMWPWDRSRMLSVLAGVLPVGQGTEGDLVACVRGVLQGMGLTQVTDELIRQLGLHWYENRRVADEKADTDASPWLLDAEHWSRVLPPDLLTSVRQRIFRFHPVSKLFPRCRAELDLARLAELAGDRPVTEMLFLPCLRRVCGQLCDGLRTMREEVIPQAPSADESPVHLLVTGLARAEKELFVPMPPREARALRHDIEDVIEKDVLERLDFGVVVTSR